MKGAVMLKRLPNVKVTFLYIERPQIDCHHKVDNNISFKSSGDFMIEVNEL